MKTLIIDIYNLTINEVNKILYDHPTTENLIILDLCVKDSSELKQLNFPITLITVMFGKIHLYNDLYHYSYLYLHNDILYELLKLPFCCSVIILKEKYYNDIKPYMKYSFSYINSHKNFYFDTIIVHRDETSVYTIHQEGNSSSYYFYI
ncbi:MAG TPA: hypothetical protein V6C58_23150 [Allocoleopsis sp.]